MSNNFSEPFSFSKSKDWVTTVLKDLELLGINKSFAEIKEMKKSSYNALLSKAINNVAFKELEKLKLSHSKVENVKHKMLQMRKYFMPSEYNATKEAPKCFGRNKGFGDSFKEGCPCH